MGWDEAGMGVEEEEMEMGEEEEEEEMEEMEEGARSSPVRSRPNTRTHHDVAIAVPRAPRACIAPAPFCPGELPSPPLPAAPAPVHRPGHPRSSACHAPLSPQPSPLPQSQPRPARSPDTPSNTHWRPAPSKANLNRTHVPLHSPPHVPDPHRHRRPPSPAYTLSRRPPAPQSAFPIRSPIPVRPSAPISIPRAPPRPAPPMFPRPSASAFICTRKRGPPLSAPSHSCTAPCDPPFFLRLSRSLAASSTVVVAHT
ncbi:hypothetical protein HETIRDRAFT_455142 [Heterobasidion irregulare TC 32-1]|uniref:Uncharacterized protein n=1 Tax=Heterobasidion irregulare (strain TC 32-1) TaxID=747525 RepID=W4JUQ0_HETIT|nr:uncharacterized protein HETIRDRAFT_455142 [Heterobasidion irregulare TC 32-1]ETW76626.1 hypothetical protein HETIRDRAFT_455142 [Heterobasidion irregulare TC 32-1]